MTLPSFPAQKSKKLGLLLLALVLFFALAVVLGSEVAHGLRLTQTIEKKSDEIESLSARAEDLARALEVSGSSPELEASARALGLGRPGETAVLLSPRQANDGSRELVNPSPLKPASAWWQYFTGGQ